MKIIEDELIVGILTETNQFVPINAPTENLANDKLQVMAYGTDNRKAETIISTSYTHEQDTERQLAIKRIRLESNFYNTFRNTVRILLSKYENRKIREKLNTIIDEPNLYINKLTQITDILKVLTEGYIEFVSYKIKDIEKLDKVMACSKDCGEKKAYCLFKDNKCTLLIPKKHLLSGHKNENIYFKRIADEMVRYQQIRDYLFTDGTFLIIEQLDYDLHNDEIVLLHDLLFKDYIEANDIPISNPYVKHNTFEDVQPADRVLSMEELQTSIRTTKEEKEQPIRKEETDVQLMCKIEESSLGTHDKLYKIFHNKTHKRTTIKYEGHINCGYELINKIIYDFTGKSIELQKIKSLLIELYSNDTANQDLYLNTIRQQGKKDIVKILVSKNISLNTLIASDNYYISNIDIFVIAKHFKLPLIILSGTKLLENNQSLMTINYDVNNPFYYIIKQHGIVANEIQRYSLLTDENSGIRISFNDFTVVAKNLIKDNAVEDGFIRKITIKPS
jgi:hypothetical protein